MIGGVTGPLKIVFALPTNDPRKWRMKNGVLTFRNGATVNVDVEGENIPQVQGDQGVTVTYHVLRDIRCEGNRLVGDVARYRTHNGVLIDVTDLASGVEVIRTSESAAPGDLAEASTA